MTPTEQLDHLALLLAASPHNLVARGDRERVRELHVDEGVAVGRLLPLAGRWLDLGTGGGLPGLALAVAAPEVEWTLLDSVGKKVDAVRGFAAELGLTGVVAVTARAEDLAHDTGHRARYDGVVSRATASLPVLMELARGFLLDGGILAAVKGPRVGQELPATARARHVLRYSEIHRQDVVAVARPTVLVTMRAQGRPPRGYPRASGVARRAPIGGRPG